MTSPHNKETHIINSSLLATFQHLLYVKKVNKSPPLSPLSVVFSAVSAFLVTHFSRVKWGVFGLPLCPPLQNQGPGANVLTLKVEWTGVCGLMDAAVYKTYEKLSLCIYVGCFARLFRPMCNRGRTVFNTYADKPCFLAQQGLQSLYNKYSMSLPCSCVIYLGYPLIFVMPASKYTT